MLDFLFMAPFSQELEPPQNPGRFNLLPGDAHSADTRECAIAQASADRYWIAPRPFLGPAFLSRLLSQLSARDRNLSNRVGRAFEERMFSRMMSLGIRCRRGDLGTKGAKLGDADLIIETDKFVALCEFKKKALTRVSNSGHDLQLAVDLSRGLINAVCQLAKQEIELLKTGQLKFVDGSRLILNGRRILKLVISLSDHGGLHDANTVRNMLRALQGATLTPRVNISSGQAAEMEEVNVALRLLATRSQEFSELVDADSEGDLYDGLLFHNVFFIEQLLMTERTADRLLAALTLGMRIVTGTRDPFFDRAALSPASL
ncbi:hypothetical protein C6P97_26405 [Burkholderia multivorans]|uniref:Uncharacterized protein n=1 Tax=Burkholderia multivorans TaxID=87883 RepID=A0AB37AJR9_9BURK|nr:hypothetical protein C6P99_29920 [Burkholderia multivorans]PRE42590.1 hypothetical protein C6P97_26405 [Burkholderia multivorans]